MNKTFWDNKRRSTIEVPIGLNILFICCGEKTEPYYFGTILKLIKNKYFEKSRGLTQFRYKIAVDAVDPLKMSQNLKTKINSKKNPYDEIWVVFDKDSFPADRFDNAINSITSNKKEHALWSNQCIELWFMLHFEYFQTQLDREDYFEHLAAHLKKKYEKNNPDIYYDIIKHGGRLDCAIDNANKLLKKFAKENSYSKKFPATNVLEFFETYKEYF